MDNRSADYWLPALVFERGSSHPTGVRSIDETRVGLSLAYRNGAFGPHARILVSPALGSYQNLAGLAGVGLRAHFELAGVHLSYGVGVHAETRLRDSLWLTYATPVEVGGELYHGNSAELQAFLGLRRPLAGRLINSFLLDPNGFDNENSRDRLVELRDERPWQLYLSVVFGRRLE
jgi:hypothetical protein